MAEEVRPRLGKGLAALLGESAPDAQAARGARRIPIEFLHPNPKNPRKHFEEDDLAGLADSIKEKGVLQPVLVRPAKGAPRHFEIIAGERRWRAAQRAGLHEIPVVELDITDQESMEFALIENVQRADLNALEEAAGYDQLMISYGYSQSDLSKIIGKSRSHVANTLRLLKLTDYVKTLVVNGSLSAGHARALLGVSEPDKVAEKIVQRGLSVRDVEAIAQQEHAVGEEPASKDAASEPKDANTRDLEKTLSDALGMQVSIAARGKGGQISIKYQSLDQFDAIVGRLRS